MKRYIWLLGLVLFAVLSGCSLRDDSGVDNVIYDYGQGLSNSLIPVIRFVQPLANQKIQTPYTIIFTVTDDKSVASVKFVFNKVTNTMTVNSSNTYAYLLQSMPDGYHPAVVIAGDNDGNTAVNAMTIVVQNPAGTPSVTWTSPLDNGWISSTTLKGQYYVNKGSLYAVDPIQIYTNSFQLLGAATYGSGSWQYVFDASGYADGATVSISVVAKADSEREATNTITVYIDNTPPLVSLTIPASNSAVAATGFTISGSASDSVSGLKNSGLRIYDDTWSVEWTSSLTNTVFDGVLYGGDYYLVLTATNNAGLTAAKTNLITAIYLPQSQITNQTADKIFTNNSVAFAGTASIGGGYSVTALSLKLSNSATVNSPATLNPSSGSSVKWDVTADITTLAEGAFYAYPIATGNSTNNAAVLTPVRYYKDLNVPTNWINTATVSTNRKNFLYSLNGYSYDDGSGIEKVTISVSNVNGVNNSYVYGNGSQTLNWDKGVYITLGTNKVTVYTTDRCGRVSAVKTKYIVGNRYIAIDGSNDFDAVTEKFSTSDGSIFQYITWNSGNIYVGINAGDIGNADVSQGGGQYEIWWICLYIATNTNDVNGIHTGFSYSGQQPVLPFNAIYHFRVKADNTWKDLQTYDGSSWNTGTYSGSVEWNWSGSQDYMEISFPVSDLGSRTQYYLVAYMIYENQQTPSYSSTYGALYTDNIAAQGYDPDFTKYIAIDLSDITTDPNSATFKKSGDYIPPTVSITNPTEGYNTTETTLTVQGTSSDIGSGVKEVWFKLDNGSFTQLSGTTSWSTNLTGLSVTNHTVSVYVVDNKNNVGTTNQRNFVISSGTYHTITCDGTLDFYDSLEEFTSSSSGYYGYITWDADYLYIGYKGDDISATSDAADKLVVVYIGTNGTAGGTTNGVLFNSIQAYLSFSAQWVINWQTDWNNCNSAYYNGSSWSWTNPLNMVQATSVFRNWTDKTLEMKIAKTDLGNPATINLNIHFISKKVGSEWIYGIIPSAACSDGYYTSCVLTQYLQFSWTTGVVPNDSSHIKP